MWCIWMNADEAETAFMGLLGDRGDRPLALFPTKLPHKDNNLIQNVKPH